MSVCLQFLVKTTHAPTCSNSITVNVTLTWPQGYDRGRNVSEKSLRLSSLNLFTLIGLIERVHVIVIVWIQ